MKGSRIRRRGFSAIILSAGLSRRMGEFKPLMKIGGRTVLDRLVSLYFDAGVSDILVVTGHRGEAIKAALASHAVTVVHNPAYDSGMFSSVLAGIKSLPSTTNAFFVHPVDIPLVRSHTISLLMDAFKNQSPKVVFPSFDGQRGHPPLIHREMEAAIALHDGRGGLRAVLRRFNPMSMDIQVADEAILMDLDTQDDYRELAIRLASAHGLSANECRVLIEKVQKLPATVTDHCRQVSRVAAALAESVLAQKADIDIHLIRSAAMVHDLAKSRPNHAAVGADVLNRMGFPAMAAIVASHMDIDVDQDSHLDGAQIVYLADKLVAGKSVTALKRQFEAKLEKFGNDPRITAHIIRRRQAAETICHKIERLTGKTIGQLLKDAGIQQKDHNERNSQTLPCGR